MNETASKKITILFNIGLTLALGYFVFLSFLFEKIDKTSTVHNIARMPFIQGHFGREIAFGLATGFVGILLLIFFMKEIWNRVVVRLTGLREITYAETYALMIIIACMTV